MRWIVSRSLRFRWLVLFGAAALMVFGATQIPNTEVDVVPGVRAAARGDPDDRPRELLG